MPSKSPVTRITLGNPHGKPPAVVGGMPEIERLKAKINELD